MISGSNPGWPVTFFTECHSCCVVSIGKEVEIMWPTLATQGTSPKAQASHFTCTVAGINITNTLSMHSTRQQNIKTMGLTCNFLQ